MGKYTLPKLLLLLLILAGLPKASTGLYAQNTIGFSPYGFSGMPDTVYAGAQLPVGAFVKNLSPNQTFSDSVQLNGYIDTGSANVSFFIPPDTLITLPPGDSIFVIIPIDFRDSYMGGLFKIGNNTIVIWPAAFSSGFGTGDSLRANVYVIDTINSVRPVEPDVIEVRCYPVPGSGGPLYITSTNQNIQPVAAIIHDSQGRVVQVSHDLSQGILTESLAPGVYYVEVFFDNEQRRTYKIIRR